MQGEISKTVLSKGLLLLCESQNLCSELLLFLETNDGSICNQEAYTDIVERGTAALQNLAKVRDQLDDQMAAIADAADDEIEGEASRENVDDKSD
jgi:hypothetical protein